MTFLAAITIVYGPILAWLWRRERKKDRAFNAEMRAKTVAYQQRMREQRGAP